MDSAQNCNDISDLWKTLSEAEKVAVGTYVLDHIKDTKTLTVYSVAHNGDVAERTLQRLASGQGTPATVKKILRGIERSDPSKVPTYEGYLAWQAEIDSRKINLKYAIGAAVAVVLVVAVVGLLWLRAEQAAQERSALIASLIADPIDTLKGMDGDAKKLAVFEQTLEHGFDPETVVNDEAILGAALRAGNADATLLLLKHGASPHPFQELYLEKEKDVPFLYPLHWVASSTLFPQPEKASIIQTMLDRGAAHQRPPADTPLGEEYDIRESRFSGDSDRDILRIMELERHIKPYDRTFVRSTDYCEMHTELSGRDYCSIMQSVPIIIRSPSTQLNILVFDLIAISNNRMFFYAEISGLIGSDPGILEVTEDRDRILVYFNSYWGSHPFSGYCKQGCFRRTEVYKFDDDHGLINYYYDARLFNYKPMEIYQR